MQGYRAAFEGKIETVAIKVNVLRADLQSEVATLPKQIAVFPLRSEAQADIAAVLFGGKSHFFDTPEDVWQCLEVWDKVVSKQVGSWQAGVRGSLGARCPDCRTRKAPTSEETFEPGGESSASIVIQGDGTIALASPVCISDSRGEMPAREAALDMGEYAA
ncbi:hypothetical protein NDU88_012011 [Pleurodeles waltl]|uniref:Uncharacterized protein n=1 Tax=Pleurodeles waltl TaxID=8319 RepID=A0AAV7R227_PLEWA|nr:hypothetical protein NDU88_012011 [Pleurodeles waltl]